MRGFPALALWKALLFAVSGWLVVRTSGRQASLALFYAAFIACGNLTAFTLSVSDPRQPYTIAQLVIDLLVLYPLAALCGGLWAAARSRTMTVR